jgi:hypothetical protein
MSLLGVGQLLCELKQPVVGLDQISYILRE